MKKGGYCRFHKNIYWGASVKKHALVKWRLYHGRGQLSIFCIQRAMTESDQLEIIHCAFLKQKYYLENPSYIYGIAGSYNEALDLIVQISEDADKKGCSGRLLEYLDNTDDSIAAVR